MNDDDAVLDRLGYTQKLRRGMTAFSNFALSFSVISILTGAVSLYGYGLQHGGPLEMALGWPLVTVMTLPVALSMAELASAYPTAGGLYHWASFLGGRGLGWVTAWLNFIGQVGVVAGVDWAFAEFVSALVFSAPSRQQVLLVYAAVLVSHGVLNHVGIRAVSVLNQLSAWYHLLGTALLVCIVAWKAPLRPAGFLLRSFVAPEPDGARYPVFYAFVVGLLQAQWTFTGYDASAHVAEETVDARQAAPRGMVASVVVSGLAGLVLLWVLTLAIVDLPVAAAADNPFIHIVQRAVPGTLGQALVWMVIGAMWFCGLSSVTSNSRMLFAFARDGGPPLAAHLSRISPRFQTPTWSVWLCVATAFGLAAWSGTFSVIVSISTIGLYASYGLPLWAAWRRRGRQERGPFHLGRYSPVAKVAAMVWIVVISVLFVLPPNGRTGIAVLWVAGFLALGWFLRARTHYRGPQLAPN